jgi:hypothetical protein
LSEQTGFIEGQVSAANVEKWLEEEILKPEYYCPKTTKKAWLQYVDGARLLNNCSLISQELLSHTMIGRSTTG